MAHGKVMMELMDILVQKRRFLIAGLLIAADVLLVTLLVSAAQAHHFTSAAHGRDAANVSTAPTAYDSPNLVTNGLFSLVDEVQQSASIAGQQLSNGVASVVLGTARSGRWIVSGVHTGSMATLHGVSVGFGFTVHTVGSGFAAVGHGIGATFAFVGQSIGGGCTLIGHSIGSGVRVASHITHVGNVGSVIRPADNSSVPVIDARAASFVFTPSASLPQTASTPQSQIIAAPIWPLRGTITTLFGVPEWPYEPIHTGLDISDGMPRGVTPVRAFKPGRIIEATRSYQGLGNHVVIDHGNGMTSVYGHLNSIAVQVGQAVDQNTILGQEGATGVATGVHLHFEIRINGNPVNPLDYIPGRP